MAENSNDNDAHQAVPRPREPDAHGQAAMLLVESLIHGLIARSAISVVEAIEIVEVAAEVQADIAADLGDSLETIRHSLALLNQISASLGRDVQSSERSTSPPPRGD